MGEEQPNLVTGGTRGSQISVIQNNIQEVIGKSGFTNRRNTTNPIQSPFGITTESPRPLNIKLNEESQMHIETLKNYHKEFNEEINDDDSFFEG